MLLDRYLCTRGLLVLDGIIKQCIAKRAFILLKLYKYFVVEG
jgi:hypothetical protein